MNRSSSCCLRVNICAPRLLAGPAAILKQSTNSVAVPEMFRNSTVEKKYSTVERGVGSDETVEPDDAATLAGARRGRVRLADDERVRAGEHAQHRGILHRKRSCGGQAVGAS